MKKHLLRILAAAVLISTAAAFTSFAAKYTANYTDKSGLQRSKEMEFLTGYSKDFIRDSLSTATILDNEDGDIETVTYYIPSELKYPDWQDRNGYYYFLSDVNTALKNTTTPDGYRVGADGRWIDENGQPISDGFGGNILNTKELFAGKTDEEIWKLQRDIFQRVGTDQKYGVGAAYFDHESNKSRYVQVNSIIVNRGRTDYMLNRNNFLNVTVTDHSDTNKHTEIILRACLGDELGLEVFNYIRSIQTPLTWADGICDPDLQKNFDLNKFNGRITDYGKTVTTSLYGDGTLDICVY